MINIMDCRYNQRMCPPWSRRWRDLCRIKSIFRKFFNHLCRFKSVCLKNELTSADKCLLHGFLFSSNRSPSFIYFILKQKANNLLFNPCMNPKDRAEDAQFASFCSCFCGRSRPPRSGGVFWDYLWDLSSKLDRSCITDSIRDMRRSM